MEHSVGSWMCAAILGEYLITFLDFTTDNKQSLFDCLLKFEHCHFNLLWLALSVLMLWWMNWLINTAISTESFLFMTKKLWICLVDYVLLLYVALIVYIYFRLSFNVLQNCCSFFMFVFIWHIFSVLNFDLQIDFVYVYLLYFYLIFCTKIYLWPVKWFTCTYMQQKLIRNLLSVLNICMLL